MEMTKLDSTNHPSLLTYIWRYFVYVMKHKWYVYKEARKLGVGFWQAFIHDFSKLSPTEFWPYMNKFERGFKDDASKYAFDVAWLHHIHHNPHHWNHWVFNNDTKGTQVLRMPEKYVREMVADWKGVAAARGLGPDNAVNWYNANAATLALHPQTRSRVETLLGIKVGDAYRQTVEPPTPREPGS